MHLLNPSRIKESSSKPGYRKDSNSNNNNNNNDNNNSHVLAFKASLAFLPSVCSVLSLKKKKEKEIKKGETFFVWKKCSRLLRVTCVANRVRFVRT